LAAEARRYDLHLHLLDRQIVDPDGREIANVDDLELTQSEDQPGTYYVTAMLIGPKALGPRIGGRLGRWMAAIARRLSDDRNPKPTRIDMALVSEIGSAIILTKPAHEVYQAPLERWLNRYLIERIPGSGHEGK